MIELKLNVSEVDYDALIAKFGGSIGGVAAMAAKALPQRAKEELAVKYLNQNSAKLSQTLESAIQKQGIGLKITGAEAKVI